MMSALRLLVVLALLGAVLIVLAHVSGLWWVAVAVGVVIGLVVRGAVGVVVTALAAGIVGWGAPLAWLAATQPVVSVASVMAGILGVGTSNSGLVIILTIVLGGVLCLCGAWVGSALRQLVSAGASPANRRAPAP